MTGAAPDQGSPLTEMISAVADGQPLTRHDRDRILLALIDQSQAGGAT